MTRAELLDALSGSPLVTGGEKWQRLSAALSEELGNTCATCKWFLQSHSYSWAACVRSGGMHRPPQDGTGYCCYWQSEERAK